MRKAELIVIAQVVLGAITHLEGCKAKEVPYHPAEDRLFLQTTS